MDAEGRLEAFDRRIHPRQSAGCFFSLIGDLPTGAEQWWRRSTGLPEPVQVPTIVITSAVPSHDKWCQSIVTLSGPTGGDPSTAASFLVVLHTLHLPTSNNRGRFVATIHFFATPVYSHAQTGGGHSPSLRQPLCRAEFNTGDHQSRLGDSSSRPDHRADRIDARPDRLQICARISRALQT